MEFPLRIELRSQDSKSCVITITLWDLMLLYWELNPDLQDQNLVYWPLYDNAYSARRIIAPEFLTPEFSIPLATSRVLKFQLFHAGNVHLLKYPNKMFSYTTQEFFVTYIIVNDSSGFRHWERALLIFF